MEKLEFPNCQLCGKDLNEMRNAVYPSQSRKVVKFCSKSHMVEYAKRKTIRKKLGADFIFWPTYNGDKAVTRNEMKVNYIQKNDDPKQVPVKAKKSKWVK